MDRKHPRGRRVERAAAAGSAGGTYVPWTAVHGGDQQNWERAVLSLTDAELASLRKQITDRATARWSFQEVPYDPEQSRRDEIAVPEDEPARRYVFIFEARKDVTLPRDYDLERRPRKS